jgi:hypothetical protein
LGLLVKNLAGWLPRGDPFSHFEIAGSRALCRRGPSHHHMISSPSSSGPIIAPLQLTGPPRFESRNRSNASQGHLSLSTILLPFDGTPDITSQPFSHSFAAQILLCRDPFAAPAGHIQPPPATQSRCSPRGPTLFQLSHEQPQLTSGQPRLLTPAPSPGAPLVTLKSQGPSHVVAAPVIT